MLAGLNCPSCDSSNPLINRFCNQCGHALNRTSVAQFDPASVPEMGVTEERTRQTVSRGRALSVPSIPTISLPVIPRLRAAFGSAGSVLERRSAAFLATGVVAVVLAQAGLYFSIELNEKAPLGYLLLLATGVALFALGSAGLWSRRRGNDSTAAGDALQQVSPATIEWNYASTVAALTGVLALTLLVVLLGAGSTWGWTLLPWGICLVAFAAPFISRFDLPDLSFRPWLRRHYPDILMATGLTGLFLGLNIHDLGDWYYSAIGDEFLFFEHARHIAESGVSSPFSQEGVYNKHPVMSSVFQAISMRVFGVDYFGWTFSETLNAALTIPGIYLLGHALGGRKAAVVSASLFTFSHFIFAFSHIGYNNLSSLPVTVWSLALLVLGWKKDNALLLYAAGVIAGLGFYTHYAGRAAMPVMFLFALTAVGPRRLVALWPVAFGFALTVAPTFIVEQEQVLTRMFGQVVGGYSEVVTGSTGDRILNNIEINLPAFNYNSTVHSYVYGPLMDPVSAVLAVLGIGFALGHARAMSSRLLLIWFGVAVVMTGVLSPYPAVAITRLVFVVPPLVLLAGVFVSQAWHWAAPAFRMTASNARVAIAGGSVALLLSAALALNLWQFWHVTPSVYPHTPEAVAVGAFRSQYCGGVVSDTVFVGQATGEGSLLTQVLTTFDPVGPLPRRLDHDRTLASASLPDPVPRCVVFVNPGSPDARPLREELARRYPDGRVLNFSNPSRTTSVRLFVRP